MRFGSLSYGSTPRQRDLEGTQDTRGWKRLANGWGMTILPVLDRQLPGQSHLARMRTGRLGFECFIVRLADLLRDAAWNIGPDARVDDKEPLDILFSSTEMMSQQSTNSGYILV